MGANVHIKDRFNRTPLTDAIEFDHHEVQYHFNVIFFQVQEKNFTDFSF